MILLDPNKNIPELLCIAHTSDNTLRSNMCLPPIGMTAYFFHMLLLRIRVAIKEIIII